MRALLLLIAILIGYGSLYPFDFTANGQWPRQMAALFSRPDLHMSRGDLVGNLLLFAPYGFVASLIGNGRAAGAAARLASWLALGLVLALVLQLAQLWLPSRVAAMSDVLANLGGMLLGVAAALPVPRVLRITAGRPILDAAGQTSQRNHVPLVLMAVWLGYQWFPLVPTLDLQNIINALKPLLRTPRFDGVNAWHTALAWCAFFKLWELSALRRVSGRTLATVALLAIAAKPLINGASISLNNVTGLGLALAALPWRLHRASLPVLIGAMFVGLLTSGLAPLGSLGPAQPFHWIPFSGFLEGSMGMNLLSLLEKTYFYGALILLITARSGRPLAAASLVAACLALIEAAQVFIPTRTAESTDPILALIIGMAIKMGVPRAERT
ncbi:MAG: VanZ family protein [Proteobacteria bacterium]|nr:VanZ family protein [Pseudomonadota bacterium]